jgi:hypothetical protein
MLGVFAETNLRRERQLEGIAEGQGCRGLQGAAALIDVTTVRQLKAKGMGASEVGKASSVARRALGERR